MNKRNLLLCGMLTTALAASAQDEALWLRYPAISPDGSAVAFSYKGDIFTVGIGGGRATQLTTNAAYDAQPVWSPDGSRIAFTSNREGSRDIYVISRDGGTPKRLTFSSNSAYPMTWLDDSTIVFQSYGMPTVQSIVFPSTMFTQVWTVTLSGSRPKRFSDMTMEDVSINKDGAILYHDMKGYEDPMRKHHRSPITRDIWLYDKGHFTQQTTFAGEDRTPRWAPDGKSYYYLSEQDGTFNVYQRQLGATTDMRQLTHFTKHPVRFLTVASDGTLCYGWNGEMYVQPQGGEPRKVTVSVKTDGNDRDLIRQTLTGGAQEVAVSPQGKEVAFVAHGDVYVTSIDYATTKRVTDTPCEERGISFSPDGRSLVYAAERDGHWQILRSTIHNKDEKQFTYATALDEDVLVKNDSTVLYPQYSPDGQSVAYYENRATLKAVDVKSKKSRTLLDGRYTFSYSDGDIGFEWSPDSKWVLTTSIGRGGWNNSDVVMVKADGSGEQHNLTESGYNDGDARFVLGGKGVLFSSDRAGYRSHGSWGAERDYYLMFLDLDAYEQFLMNKEERALRDEAQKEKKDEAKKDENDPAKKPEVKKDSTATFDFDNCRDRIVRLTVNSSRLGDAIMDQKGENLYYQAAFEGGYDLWKHNLLDNSTSIIVKNFGGGSMVADKKLENVYTCNGGIRQYKLGSNQTKNISFEAPFNYRPYQERELLFDHVWREIHDKFYDKNLHGVDWEGYREAYRRFLPYINNNYDFADMLSEMLGELNASHTGARFYGYGTAYPTARLGLFYDDGYQGDGLKVKEVIKRSPLTKKDTKVTPGCVITAIDGETIKAGADYSRLLDGKAGRRVRLTVRPADGGKTFDVTVRAISMGEEQELLYKRWVDHNRHLVDSLSNGRLAYVHVKAMDSESFRTVFSELLSDKNRNRDAVIVDERHNGGGWLHDDLCTLLSGKEYQKFMPRGKYIGSDPWNKWNKPSCVLICEDDYSNGHGFPLVYHTLGIGKLIGTPVAGTMTAVWWERLMDRSLVFGIPQVGCQQEDGTYAENHTLYPDITVYNTPEDLLQGRDQQLAAAVKEMLKEVDVKK